MGILVMGSWCCQVPAIRPRGSDGSGGHNPSTCRHGSGGRSAPAELAVHHVEHDGGAVRTDRQGHLVGAAMEDARWIDQTTLEVQLRKGIRYQDGEALSAESFRRAFDEVQRWKAPHPPGTYLNFHPDTRLAVVDGHTVRMRFPRPDGLVLGKFRGFHLPSTRFWEQEGFGYRQRGSGEGHW